MKESCGEIYGVYYDNQSDTWEKLREVPMVKNRLDEEADNIHSFVRFYKWILG